MPPKRKSVLSSSSTSVKQRRVKSTESQSSLVPPKEAEQEDLVGMYFMSLYMYINIIRWSRCLLVHAVQCID